MQLGSGRIQAMGRAAWSSSRTSVASLAGCVIISAVALVGAGAAAGCGGGRGAASQPTVTRPVAARPTPVDDGPAPAIRGPRGQQIALTTVDGGRVTLAELGKPVTVIALWATYCKPCLDELPLVDALWRAHRDDPAVAVLAVNIEELAAEGQAGVTRLERELGLELPRYRDGGALMTALAPLDADGQPRFLMPLLVVIDREFQLHRRIGFDAGEPRARYLAEKEALIAAAGRGETPEPEVVPGGPGSPGGANLFKLKLPRLTGAELAGFGARFRAELAQIFPHLAADVLDELTRRAVEASRTGGVLEVDLGAVTPATPPR